MNKRIYVVGFSKCGTMSLEEMLRKQNPECDVIRSENIFDYDMSLEEIEIYKNSECHVITRNPLDRIESCHRYFKQLKNMTVKELCNSINPYLILTGCKNIIEQSDYKKYINEFENRIGVKLIIHSLEEMKKNPDFPLVNETLTPKFWTTNDRNYVKSMLELTEIC